MNAVYKFVLCIMRRFIKNDKINAVVAGFLAGLMSRLDVKSRRQFLLILLLSRLTDTTFTMAEKRGAVTRIPYGEVLLFVFCSLTQQYAMGCEQDILNRGQYHFMKKWSSMEGNPQQMMAAWNKRIRDDIATSAPAGWTVNFGATD